MPAVMTDEMPLDDASADGQHGDAPTAGTIITDTDELMNADTVNDNTVNDDPLNDNTETAEPMRRA